MCKKNGILFASVVLSAVVLLLLTACELFNNKPEVDLLKDVDDKIAYANAPFATISFGIIPGSLSAAPTEAPRQKVGYPFTVQATANSGYGFSGWRVLAKAQWDGLNKESPTFDADFITAAQSANVDNVLATISDTLGLDGKPSGGATITAHTANPLVIVPYATVRPAISTSYPALYAYNIPVTDQVEIHFDAPVTESSFEWGSDETPAFTGDLKNITISAVKADGVTSLADYTTIEALFEECSLSPGGNTLYLRLSAAIPAELNFERCKITITLGDEIERRGAEGVKIMPRQSLVYTVTTMSAAVDTRLVALTVDVEGVPVPYDFSTQLSTALEYNITCYAAESITINADAVQIEAVNISASDGQTNLPAAESPFSGTLTPFKGKSTITIMVRQKNGGIAFTQYKINLTNYPAQTPPDISTITGGNGTITLAWGEDAGASGYEVRWGQGGDPSAAQKADVSTNSYIIENLSAGQTYNVWVRSAASNNQDGTVYYGPYSNVMQATTFSSTARLASLSVTGATLSPAFSADTYNYSVNVNNQTSLILSSINAETQNNGSVAVSGNSGFAAGRNLNKIAITVTPQNNGTPQTYYITVNNYPATTVPEVTLTTPVAQQINANWGTAVGGASSYEVRYSTGTNLDTATAQPVPGAGTISAAITGLSAGTTYNVWVRAVAGSEDDILYGNYSTVKTATTQSPVARLATLSVTGATLSPAFSADIYNYSVNVNNLTTLTLSSINAEAQNNGSVAVSGNSGFVPGRNLNKITIKVTPQNGGTPQDYRITVNNYPAATAPTVTLTTPVAQQINANWGTAVGGASSYEVRYSTGTNQDTATPQPVTGATTTSSDIIELSAGTTYNVWVRAVAGSEDNALYGNYSTVKSATTQSSVARLATLSVTGGTLNPAFNPATFLYSENVYNRTDAYEVTAAAQSGGNVKIGLNTSTPAEGSPASLTLAKGINTIIVQVRPQNGGTAQNYTITVNNYPVGEPELSVITPGVDPSSKKGKIDLEWPAVNGADSYRILYSTSNNMNSINTSGTPGASSGVILSTSGTTTISGVIPNLNANTTYYVFVQAVSGTAEAAKLYSAPGLGSATTPANDARLAALSLSDNTLSPPFNPDIYQYELTADLANSVEDLTIGTDGATASKFSYAAYSSGATAAIDSGDAPDVGLTPVVIRVTTLYGTSKDYTIKAYKKPPRPTWKTPSSPTIAGKPFNNAQAGKIDVNWNTVSGVNGYEIYQNTSDSTISGGTAITLSGEGTASRSMIVAADNKYYFYVRAFKTTAGRTVYSDYSTADTAAPTISTWQSLDNLTHTVLGAGAFSFSPQTTDYSFDPKYTAIKGSIGITPIFSPANDYTSVTVGGVSAGNSGTQSVSYTMDDSTFSAAIPVVVKAEHPNYTKTYSIAVARRGIRIGSGAADDYATLADAFSAYNTVYLDEGQEFTENNQIDITGSGTIKTLRTVPGQTGSVKITTNTESDGTFFMVKSGATLNLGVSGESTPITIYGTGFGSVGSTCIVRIRDSGSTGNMYNGFVLSSEAVGVYLAGDVAGGTFNFVGGLINYCRIGVTKGFATEGHFLGTYNGPVGNPTFFPGCTTMIFP
ncbi:hypothetical protein AGMMS50293_18940 [Spirochaetia bacterium]|nr:hypothetical protein AGMMS50293_18940 [Spirochaetia bacterium]